MIIQDPYNVHKLIVLDSDRYELGSVQYIESLGNDDTFFRTAKVCVGKGFDVEVPEDEVIVQNLINTLYNLRHHRVFELGGITFGIECPIFVERQLRTYRKPEIERSLRYCEPIELDDSGFWKRRDTIAIEKQNALRRYKELREQGVKKEEARRVLPVDTKTQVVSYYTIRSLFHVFDERLDKAAQSETTAFVQAMYDLTKRFYPLTINAYENRR